MNFDIIGRSKLFLLIAAVLVIASWVSVFAYGLEAGIDLEGGTQWRVEFMDESVTTDSVAQFIESEFDYTTIVTTSGEDFIIEFQNINEEEHVNVASGLTEEFGEFEEKSFTSVGPIIGEELRKKSVWAILGVLIGIFAFVAWSFRKVSHPIGSWKYGLVAIVTLFHDVSLPIGMFAFLGSVQGVEVNTQFIVALLVILGFSVNDTIVVFDRIRENLLLEKGKAKNLLDIINRSVNETIMRSVNTSVTLIVVLAALLVFGPQSLYYFILTILVGTVVGTYSSIFVASPALYLWGREK